MLKHVKAQKNEFIKQVIYQDIEKIPALVEKKDFDTAFYIINSCKSKANQMQADKEIQVLIKKSRELVESAKNNPSGIGFY